jgi:hypothetical protein
VRKVVPGCKVVYAGQGGADPRSYRVDFSKIHRELAMYQPRWSAWAGAEELKAGFERYGLMQEDFQGRRFTRLAQLKYLLDGEYIDASLRWIAGVQYVAKAA